MKFLKKNKKQPQRSSSISAPNDQQRVFSYYTSSHNKINQSSRSSSALDTAKTAHRYAKNNFFTVLIFTVLVFIVGALLALVSEPKVTVNGTEYRSADEYRQISKAALSTNVLNKFKPTLQRNSLNAQLQNNIPEAKSIEVSAPLLGLKPVITINTDNPAAVLQQPGNKDLIISDRGRLLLPKRQSQSTLNLPVIVNQSSVVGKEGEQFIRPDDMQSLTRLFYQIGKDSSTATYILPVAPREFVMIEPSRGEYQVKFLFGDTILQQYGQLRAAQKKLTETNQKPSEYMDVRVAGKVFYK